MDAIIGLITKIAWQDWIVAINALLIAIIGIALLIPGPEPERTIQKLVDFLTKFSKK